MFSFDFLSRKIIDFSVIFGFKYFYRFNVTDSDCRLALDRCSVLVKLFCEMVSLDSIRFLLLYFVRIDLNFLEIFKILEFKKCMLFHFEGWFSDAFAGYDWLSLLHSRLRAVA